MAHRLTQQRPAVGVPTSSWWVVAAWVSLAALVLAGLVGALGF